MKKSNYIYMALALVLFQQCSEDDPEKYKLNEQFQIKQEEIITLDLEDDNGYIEIQMISIADSRCPSDVTCVRYGEAEVRVAVNGLEEIATLVDLCVGDCLHRGGEFLETDTAEVQIDNLDYAVILHDVIPYPTTTNQSIPKEAVLRIISL